MADCILELRFTGRTAEVDGSIDMYDGARALIGFERTISLTTHLLLNGEVLTQSPATKGFEVLLAPVEQGSRKAVAKIFCGGAGATILAAGVAPPDTAFGWLAKSALEYVIEETLGFEPNFEDTLGNQIEEYRSQESNRRIADDLSQERFDALLEKTEASVKDVHRPVVFSATAEVGAIDYRVGSYTGTMDPYFDQSTYDYIDRTVTSDDFSEYEGVVSSYNTNTFKGRVYLEDSRRTVPFEISENIRNLNAIDLLTSSLRRNGRSRARGLIRIQPDIQFEALRNETPTGRLKSFLITNVDSL